MSDIERDLRRLGITVGHEAVAVTLRHARATAECARVHVEQCKRVGTKLAFTRSGQPRARTSHSGARRRLVNMKQFLVVPTLAVGSLFVLDPTHASADPLEPIHGGVYRGPGDTVPPGAGGGNGNPPPTTGNGPQGPGPEGPKRGPVTPPPGTGPPLPGPGLGGRGEAPSTGDYVDTGSDLTTWSFWWEFNKSPFLDLRSSVNSGRTLTGSIDHFLGEGDPSRSTDSYRPSEEEIRDMIVPALLAALESERSNDIVTGCLIALAKIGEGGEVVGKARISDVIARFLTDPNQEISETAALALGILGDGSVANVQRLRDLVGDTPAGRSAVGEFESSVPNRTRTFAAYGLGLVGARAELGDPRRVRQRIAQTLVDELVVASRLANQDLGAALVISLGLLPLHSTGTWPEQEYDFARGGAVDSLETQMQVLMQVFEDSRLDRYMRAHVPTALARLLQSTATLASGSSAHRELKRRVAELLLEPLDPRKGNSFEEVVQQSCCLALGLIADADLDELDARIRARLLEAHEKQQRQAKNFALIALARIAARPGEANDEQGAPVSDDARFGSARAIVSRHFESRLSRGVGGEEHFAGLGIGVMNFDLQRTAQKPEVSPILALRSALEKSKAIEDIGAFAISSAIARDRSATGALERLLRSTTDPVARGYVALALGLLGADEARESIRAIVAESEYRPELLRQAAIALALLGDKEAVPMLLEMLADAKSNASHASLATALGIIGDRRSVMPLVQMLEDVTLTDGARGFAAVALGIVADKEPLPFNSKIAVDLNYRASLPTLTSPAGTGVIDIL